MSNQNQENYFEVSEAEIDGVVASVLSDVDKDDVELIGILRGHIRTALAERKDPSKRLSQSVINRYGFDPLDGHVKYDDSKEAKRDQGIYMMTHCFETAKGHLEMIATDNSLSSVDVKRYTSDNSKSEIFTPAQVAANCLETLERFYKEIGGNPGPGLRSSIAAKYGISENGTIKFNSSVESMRDFDICNIDYSLDTIKLALKTIAEKSETLSSRDVTRYVANSKSKIYTPAQMAAGTIDQIRDILNRTPSFLA